MSRTASLLFCLAISGPALALADPIESPIVGGEAARPGQFPNVVAVEIGHALCTGTLLTKDWVMTAAHCLTPREVQLPSQEAVTASVRVVFGTVDLMTGDGTAVAASETIPDPAFDPHAFGTHDTGLIKLATPITDVTPVAINLDASNAPAGIDVVQVGFGITTTDGDARAGREYFVRQTSMPCPSGVGSDGELLCFSQADGEGSCFGDSGGPSFAMIDDHAMEVGITSFGDSHCAKFGADTRVDAEQDFLLAQIPELACSPNCPSDPRADDPGITCDAGGAGAATPLLGLALAGLLHRRRRRR